MTEYRSSCFKEELFYLAGRKLPRGSGSPRLLDAHWQFRPRNSMQTGGRKHRAP